MKKALQKRVAELEAMVKDRESQIKYHIETKEGLRTAYNSAADREAATLRNLQDERKRNLDLQAEKEKYRVLSIALARFGGIAQQ